MYMRARVVGTSANGLLLDRRSTGDEATKVVGRGGEPGEESKSRAETPRIKSEARGWTRQFRTRMSYFIHRNFETYSEGSVQARMAVHNISLSSGDMPAALREVDKRTCQWERRVLHNTPLMVELASRNETYCGTERRVPVRVTRNHFEASAEEYEERSFCKIPQTYPGSEKCMCEGVPRYDQDLEAGAHPPMRMCGDMLNDFPDPRMPGADWESCSWTQSNSIAKSRYLLSVQLEFYAGLDAKAMQGDLPVKYRIRSSRMSYTCAAGVTVHHGMQRYIGSGRKFWARTHMNVSVGMVTMVAMNKDAVTGGKLSVYRKNNATSFRIFQPGSGKQGVYVMREVIATSNSSRTLARCHPCQTRPLKGQFGESREVRSENADHELLSGYIVYFTKGCQPIRLGVVRTESWVTEWRRDTRVGPPRTPRGDGGETNHGQKFLSGEEAPKF
ncbi:hypothetical protein EDC04DRAFT_2603874 [Pisolithus marmoratus]|nr:hypothetical protein EDC04DRAFT_2603874 [Pisolithus marmoratus]